MPKTSIGYRLASNQNVPKGRRRYIFDVTVLGKKHRKVVVSAPSLVEATFKEWLKRVQEGEQPDAPSFFETMAQYMQHVRTRYPTPYADAQERTARRLRSFLSKDLPLASVTRGVLQSYIDWRILHPEHAHLVRSSVATVNRDISMVSRLYTFAIERGYFAGANPASRLKAKEPEREVTLSRETLEELLALSQDRGKLFTAVLLALFAGLRRREVATLLWTDIDFDGAIIRLKPGNTKGSKRRIVALPTLLVDHLKDLRKKEPFHDRVFYEWKGSDGLRCAWDRLRRGAPNLRDIHFHDLRHCYAQHLRDQGVPLGDIATLLGHSSTLITERYYAQFGGRIDLHKKVETLANVVDIRPSIGHDAAQG